MMHNPSNFSLSSPPEYITIVPLHKDFITPKKEECTYSLFSCEEAKVLPRSVQSVRTGLQIRLEEDKDICAHIFGGGVLKSSGLLIEPQLFDKAKDQGLVLPCRIMSQYNILLPLFQRWCSKS